MTPHSCCEVLVEEPKLSELQPLMGSPKAHVNGYVSWDFRAEAGKGSVLHITQIIPLSPKLSGIPSCRRTTSPQKTGTFLPFSSQIHKPSSTHTLFVFLPAATKDNCALLLKANPPPAPLYQAIPFPFSLEPGTVGHSGRCRGQTPDSCPFLL